ncbi:MAG: hypothetical protein H6741_05780 [Alphaproteobacteria bacterium]|nr:hypothetical protein [Alphaproteobacteria bacterium]MCB9792217.1 hypothetical protein [Alphaproteobacteria bacterium]
MKCRSCGSHASGLVRFCPGCGETLSQLGAEAGQLVARPTPQASDASERWFAAVRGNDKRPRRVEGVEMGVSAASLRLAEGGEETLEVTELLRAAAEDREWVSVE